MKYSDKNYNIKISLEYLSNLCLKEAETFKEYSDEDLLNACFIFQHIFMSKMWEHQRTKKLTMAQRGILATEAGKSLRQTVLLFTGKDMKIITKKLMEKK